MFMRIFIDFLIFANPNVGRSENVGLLLLPPAGPLRPCNRESERGQKHGFLVLLMAASRIACYAFKVSGRPVGRPHSQIAV